jgi:glycerol uptake facilitator-like aquaporin
MVNIPGAVIEFLGSFIFFIVILATRNAWVIGATLALLIFVFGKISGGHYSPSVTLMMLYNNNIMLEDAITFIVVQITAAILAVKLWNRVGDNSQLLTRHM